MIFVKRVALLAVVIFGWFVALLLSASCLMAFGGVGSIELGLLGLFWLVIAVLVWRSQSKKLDQPRDGT